MSTPLELPPGNAPICRIREFDQELGGAVIPPPSRPLDPLVGYEVESRSNQLQPPSDEQGVGATGSDLRPA